MNLNDYTTPKYGALFELGPDYDLGVELFHTINDTIDGRIAMVEEDAGIIAQMVAMAGDGNHLEVGAFMGGTATLAACVKAAKGFQGNIYCVDNFSYQPVPGVKVTEETVLVNAAHMKVRDRVQVYKGQSVPLPIPEDVRFASALIDAAHDYNSAIRDWKEVEKVTEQYVAFHDADRGHLGVVRAVSEAAQEWQLIYLAHHTAILERA